MDYASVYSHFRVKKCLLTISRQRSETETGLTDNYLMVGSRPFASMVPPQALQDQVPHPGGANQIPGIANSVPDYRPATLVPPQQEDALRQTRWQHVHSPLNTKPYLHVGFYPYTLVGTFGPSGTIPDPPQVSATAVVQAIAYQRLWEARKWMPFTWAGGASGSNPITFFGPFMVTDRAGGTGEIGAAITYNVTLTLYCQFKGQK